MLGWVGRFVGRKAPISSLIFPVGDTPPRLSRKESRDRGDPPPFFSDGRETRALERVKIGKAPSHSRAARSVQEAHTGRISLCSVEPEGQGGASLVGVIGTASERYPDDLVSAREDDLCSDGAPPSLEAEPDTSAPSE